jgi:hypothetical protein
MTPTAYSQSTNSYITDYIKVADAKAGAIIGGVVALGTALGATAQPVIAAAHQGPQPTAACVLLCVLYVCTALAMVLAIIHSLGTLSPRTPSAEKSLNSFPDIASMSVDAYATAVAGLNETLICNNYARHNATLARIAMAKFAHVKKSLKSLSVSLYGSFAILVMYFLCQLGQKGS